MDIEQAPVAVPTIPVPRPDLVSLTASVTALKQAVERMMRAPKPLGTARRPAMFIQSAQPMRMQDGDFWLQSGEKSTLSVAFNSVWYVVGTLS